MSADKMVEVLMSEGIELRMLVVIDEDFYRRDLPGGLALQPTYISDELREIFCEMGPFFG